MQRQSMTEFTVQGKTFAFTLAFYSNQSLTLHNWAKEVLKGLLWWVHTCNCNSWEARQAAVQDHSWLNCENLEKKGKKKKKEEGGEGKEERRNLRKRRRN